MKKVILFLILLIPSFISAKEIVYCERTYDDLKINESIDINTINIEDVMNTPCVKDENRIYDFGDILTDSEEETLEGLVKSYIEAYTSDYVILTIEKNPECNYDLETNCSSKYAENFYNYNNFKKNGILVLIDLQNKTNLVSIYTFGNVTSIFTKSTINSILDYSYKYFNNNEYLNGFKDIIYNMSSYYKKDLSFYNETKVTTVKTENKYFIYSILIFLISFSISLIFMTFNYNKSKIKKDETKENTFVKNNGINKVNDLLVSENEIISDLSYLDDYNFKGDIL